MSVPELNMKTILLLIFTVGCSGIHWKTINGFKDIFMEYSQASEKTLKYIDNFINSSRHDSNVFFERLYASPLLRNLTDLRSSKIKCYENFIEKDNVKLSFEIQIFQIEIPIQRRVIEIREKMNDINSSINMYQGLADSKYWGCKVFNESCVELTENWLKSKINSLACAVYPNCVRHSITKRSTCSSKQFRCHFGCIDERFFCNGNCDCRDCQDEPSGCVQDCTEFRCEETFRCISPSLKCDGKDDCGDGSDEEGCPQVYSRANCSTNTGGFLCDTAKCLDLEQVCDGKADCADGTDEGTGCLDRGCSPDCGRKGGVCWAGPGGHECLYECPPGTFETTTGCSTRPEASPSTLAQLMDDTPRLTARHAARMKYLKTKTMLQLSRSMLDVAKCKGREFTLLSKAIQFSPELYGQNKSISISSNNQELFAHNSSKRDDVTTQKYLENGGLFQWYNTQEGNADQ